MGITPNYNGFFQTLMAVQLALQDPSQLTYVTKFLYPDVADSYGTSWSSVERNIRTIISIAWECNHPLLEQVARRPLIDKPKVSQFLSFLTAYCAGEDALH